MSKGLAVRFNEINKRMDAILIAMDKADPLSTEYEELSKMAHSELETMQALNISSVQQLGMHWTASGDFSHLQSTPPVRF